MEIFKERNKWIRHKYTQLLLDDDDVIHIGKSMRQSGLPAVVADVMNSLNENGYVLFDFAQCSAPLATALHYKAEHIFLSETMAVFYNKLLKCVLPLPANINLYTTSGDPIAHGVVMDSPEACITILNEEVQIEPHALLSPSDHLTEICGCIQIKDKLFPVWLVSEPNLEETADALQGEAANAANLEEVKPVDDLLINKELTENVVSQPNPPVTESQLPEEGASAPSLDAPVCDKPKSSLYENFVYQPRVTTPPQFEILTWGGVKMVRFHVKVTTQELLQEVLQVDIYHFAKDANVNLIMPLLSNNYVLFIGEGGTIWTGKTLIKKDILEVLGDGVQRVKTRKQDSSPRVIPVVMQGPVIKS